MDTRNHHQHRACQGTLTPYGLSGYPDIMGHTIAIADILDTMRGQLDELQNARDGLEQLRLLNWLQGSLQDLVEANVSHARFCGDSWADIGNALGTTRQSAHERFRHVPHA